MREAFIDEAKTKGQKTVKIPNWYFTNLLKNDDKFDMFRSSVMPKYYGIKEINWTPAFFDYSILNINKPFILNKSLKDDLKLNAIYYIDGHKIFQPNQLILEFNQLPKNYKQEQDNIFYIHLFTDKHSEYLNKNRRFDQFTEIKGKYYSKIEINDLNYHNIKKLDFGFHNSETEKNSAEFSVDLSNLQFK